MEGRRDLHGLSPGSSPQSTSEGRGGRRSARPACRYPCRRRSSRPSRCRLRAENAPGWPPSAGSRGPRDRAVRGCRSARGTVPSSRRMPATGSTRCRRLWPTPSTGRRGARESTRAAAAVACLWRRSGIGCSAGRNSRRSAGHPSAATAAGSRDASAPSRLR